MRTETSRASVLCFVIVFLGVLATNAFAQTGALPRWFDVYSVKFLCGRCQGNPDVEGVVKPGNYLTAINIHNPNGQTVVFRKRAVLMYREDSPPTGYEIPQRPYSFHTVDLRAGWGLEIDCADIRDVLLKDANMPAPPAHPTFIKGWVILEALAPSQTAIGTPLDVVTAYTSHGFTAGVNGAAPTEEGFSIDIEPYTPKRILK